MKENLHQDMQQLQSKTRPQRNCSRFTMTTKVTVSLLGISCVSFLSFISSRACSRSLFCNLFSPVIFNLTLKYLLEPSNWTPHLQYFPCPEPGFPFMAKLIFLNDDVQWVMTDFFKSLNYLVCQFKMSTVWLWLPLPDLSPATPEFPYSFSKDALCFPTCSSWLLIFPLPGMPSHLVAVLQHILLCI